MAIAYKSVGTTTATGTTTAIFTYPGTIVAGDMLILGVTNKYPPNVPGTLSGYTAILNGQGSGGAGAAGTDAGTVTVSTFYKVATGVETGAATISVPSANSAGANVMVFSPTSAQYDWVTPQAGFGADSTRGTSWSITAGSTMDIIAGDIVAVFSGANADAQTYSAELLAMGGITSWGAHTERADTAITGGNDQRLILSTHTAAAGTATTAGTFTMTANGTLSAGVSVLVRLREYWARGTVDPGEGTQAQTGDASIVYAAYPVSFDDGFQTQIGDAADVTFSDGSGPVLVTPDDGFQAQAGDEAIVRAGYPVSPADGLQAQTGDAATVRAGYNLTGAEGNQTQTGDAATVRAGYAVTFTDGFQTQTGDDATLTEVVGSITITPTDGFQTQTGDAVTVNAGYNLSPSDGFQAQTGDSATVRAYYPVTPVDGYQTQTGDSPVTFAGYFVVCDQGYQAQTGDPFDMTELAAAAAQTPRLPSIVALADETIVVAVSRQDYK